MALAADEIVYLNVGDGICSDPPLFGRVNFTGGTTPDVVGVNWENGANQTFDAAAPAQLVEIDAPTANSPLALAVGKTVRLGDEYNDLEGRILRTWIADPDGTPSNKMLVLTDFGYVVADFRAPQS